MGTGQWNLGRDTERQLSGLLRHGRYIHGVTLGRPWRIVSAFYCNMGSKAIGEPVYKLRTSWEERTHSMNENSVGKTAAKTVLQSEMENNMGVQGCRATSHPASCCLETLCDCNWFDSSQ